MRADSTQPRYAPSSVGGLMEPAFLRGARHDADGGPPELGASSPALWRRFQAAVQHVVAAMRPH